ncbi:ATP-dependent Clp protease proteolytic subunit [Bacteroides caecimuris]|uniref:ATP-dependent Clp protease proteolytic subunit n=1 Tax=Bacteroides caecimuris TaxID=1796613 RepID=UPI00243318D2|nr:ATP-dependent Clp protease proteolytic subunit [Bacteroides caecimuris]
MEESVLEVNGMIDHYGWQRTNIKWHLNKNKGKKVRCKINSWGGSVNEAIAISKLFEEHGNVTVEFIGFCASAVTWMAFGAASIEIHEDSLWLCHKSSIPVEIYGSMNSDQIESTIKQLQNEKKSQDAIDLIIAKKYADKCAVKGKTIKDVFDLMKEERWIPADECLDWGFVDHIIPGINKVSNDFRNLMIENCVALKLPAPSFPVDSEPNNDGTNNSYLKKILDGLNAFVFSNKKETCSEDAQTNINSNKNQTMNKTFVAVNTLLAVEGLTENDGKVELTIEQMQKVCDAVKQGEVNKTTVDNAVTALDSISPNVKAIDGLTNKIHAVKALVNLIPSGTPAGNSIPKNTPEDKNYEDSKKDPVNHYFTEDED